MNTAEKYIYRVYAEKSFSRAAKSLFVSQPSLSAVVSHKETELGFRIFDRSSKPVTLTPEGHIYIEMLEEMQASEKNMQRRVKKLTRAEHRSLAIGGASASLYYLMPSLCGAFFRRYPDMEVLLDLGNLSAASALTERLSHFQKLDRGDLDVVFSYEYDATRYIGEKVYGERLVVAMRDELVSDSLRPYALRRDEVLCDSYPREKKMSAKNAFSGIPFIDFDTKGSTLLYMNELIGEHLPSPYRIQYARHSMVHFNMMCAGVGALLTNDVIIAMSNIGSDNISYFVFDKATSMRNIYAITRKNSSRGSGVRNFIDLAKQIFSDTRHLRLYVE